MAKPQPAEEMTEAELTGEIARLTARIEALKTLRATRIAIEQTRSRARRMLALYQQRTVQALEAVRATEEAGRAAA